jgi:hypothetical protein
MIKTHIPRAEAEVYEWRAKCYERTKNLTREERVAYYAKIEDGLRERGMGHLLAKNAQTPVAL